MPRARNIHRNSSEFELHSADTSDGWRVIKHVSFAYGEARCAAGEWRRLHNEFGQHTGYQPLAPRYDVTSDSDVSRAALAMPEIFANAGVLGRSRTAHMKSGDPDRVGRRHPKSGRLLPEEDFIERAKTLVKAYPHSANFHDMKRRGMSDRAVRVYPKG